MNSSPTWGLLLSDINYIQNLFARYPQIVEVIIFGSRALGNFKIGSDVDLAVKGAELDSILPEILAILEHRSSMPYHFDLLDFEKINNQNLKEHINQVGQVFYSKFA